MITLAASGEELWECRGSDCRQVCGDDPRDAGERIRGGNGAVSGEDEKLMEWEKLERSSICCDK